MRWPYSGARRDKAMSEKEPTDLELFEQIMKNQKAMSEVIRSHEAQIKRLQFRLDRIERGTP
jgi:hypothetical protein